MNKLLITLILIPNLAIGQVTKVWETNVALEVPESVKYYDKENCIFVSNVSGKPSEKDGNGFISKLSADGKIIELKWVDELNAPKGMAIKEGLLYVSDIDYLVIIDIKKAVVVRKIHQPHAKFLNDVAITHTGDILISDSSTSVIYKLDGDELTVWLKNTDLGRINGLYAEKKHVLLGTNSNIVKIDVTTKKTEVFLETGGQADGIEADGQGGYYYSFWKGELYHYIPGKDPVQLLNTAEQNVQCADIGFNPHTNEILVPTFFANQVVSYKAH
ncbi:hypothetical protein KEM09_07255 [Carboxylicivirga mesophila]|uniref:ATP/GTP-binding protein n=1 Tax=Carboxylicivirga mesophila TaxID=1166478 RepID=A0ABS5K8J9_9BACT|nr:hypothetical protein [Carboxylicivirga mesophila]MBS2211192.1 hypothetical protein [Carboxylicivirga mesophila]